MNTPGQRIEALRSLLNQHSHEYYVLDRSTLSDTDYDALYRELVELETKYPQFLDPDSPTQRIGAKSTSGFKKVKHTDGRMLSLENIRTPADVIKYLGKQEVVIEPKLDGVSLKLIYVKGRLQQALTRGDGTEGDDVTANARAIRTIPLQITGPFSLTVKGEVYMTNTVFTELNKARAAAKLELLANPRNAASGAVKLLDPAEVAASHLSFVAYDLSTEVEDVSTQKDVAEFLAELGFQNVYNLPLQPTVAACKPVARCFVITDEATLAAQIAEADAARKCLDLPTDGLVFKLNSLAAHRELGVGNKYPNYACAFKFAEEQVATTLIGVTIQIGRTGQVTPVAELKPVALGGTVVRRASLCNQDEVNRLNINVGDEVLVQRSAEVVPKIVGVAKKAAKGVYKLPTTCPCCRTPLVRPEGYVDSFCPNADCDDRVFGVLYHACSKEALDIDGCGEAMVRSLMEHGVRTLVQLFKVDPQFLKPAARRSFEAGRAACKAQPLWRKYAALGIEGFGRTGCQTVASRWPSLTDAFTEQLRIEETRLNVGTVKTPEIALSDVVGPVVYGNLIEYCRAHREELDELDSLIGMIDGGQLGDLPLKGKACCITGLFESGNRRCIEQLVEDAGGLCKSSVTRKVDFLIQGGTETGNNKKADAQRLGVPVISEHQLYAMIGKNRPTVEATTKKEY